MQNCSNKKALTTSTASTIISSSPVTISITFTSPVTFTTTDNCDALLNDSAWNLQLYFKYCLKRESNIN